MIPKEFHTPELPEDIQGNVGQQNTVSEEDLYLLTHSYA